MNVVGLTQKRVQSERFGMKIYFPSKTMRTVLSSLSQNCFLAIGVVLVYAFRQNRHG